ncbi:CEP164 [Symbiodinium microadriaticum]|nr:CEP164 [Symbiodinium microadriaticum]
MELLHDCANKRGMSRFRVNAGRQQQRSLAHSHAVPPLQQPLPHQGQLYGQHMYGSQGQQLYGNQASIYGGGVPVAPLSRDPAVGGALDATAAPPLLRDINSYAHASAAAQQAAYPGSSYAAAVAAAAAHAPGYPPAQSQSYVGQPYAGSQQPYVSQQAYPGTGQYSAAGQQAAYAAGQQAYQTAAATASSAVYPSAGGAYPPQAQSGYGAPPGYGAAAQYGQQPASYTANPATAYAAAGYGLGQSPYNYLQQPAAGSGVVAYGSYQGAQSQVAQAQPQPQAQLQPYTQPQADPTVATGSLGRGPATADQQSQQQYLDMVWQLSDMSLNDKQALPAPPAQQPPAPPAEHVPTANWQRDGAVPAAGSSAAVWNSFDDAAAKGMVDGLVGDQGMGAQDDMTEGDRWSMPTRCESYGPQLRPTVRRKEGESLVIIAERMALQLRHASGRGKWTEYLGIDPITDGDLMWIADEALAAPLPSEWTEHHDSADRVFYYNVQTHASSWTHPLEQMHRDTYKSIVHYRSGEVSKEDQVTELERLKRKCDDAERESIRELQAWSEHTDEGGQKFFYNREKQVSVWTDPRPARCHALYVQMRALRDMSKHCGQAVPGLGPMDDPRRDKLRIQQTLVIGNVDPLGRSTTRDKRDDDSRLAGGSGTAGQKDEEKKKKKKHKEGKHKKEGGNEELLDLTEDGDGEIGAPDIFNKKSGLDVKKPSLSAVEEVRQALGVAPGSNAAGSQSDPRGLSGGLPSINQGSFGRLPQTPPGDGLSSVGRAKVRAGRSRASAPFAGYGDPGYVILHCLSCGNQRLSAGRVRIDCPPAISCVYAYSFPPMPLFGCSRLLCFH